MEEYNIDQTKVIVDGDTVFSVTAGTTSLETAKVVLGICADVLAKHNRLFMLTDVSKGFSVSSEVRRFQSEWAKAHVITGSALYGAGAVTRAMVTLIHGAMTLVGKNNFRIGFFATEAEARAWIDEIRSKLPPAKAAAQMK